MYSSVWHGLRFLNATLRMESSWLSWPSITAPNSPAAEEERHGSQRDPRGWYFLQLAENWGERNLRTLGDRACVRVGDSPSPSVFPKATLCRSTMTSRSFSFSSSLMPRLFTEKRGRSHEAGLVLTQCVPRGTYHVMWLNCFHIGSKLAPAPST